MNSRRDYDSALAAEYALGTLRGAARQRFARRLLQEPELAAEVGRWQHALAELDHNVKPVTPPQAVWQRLAHSLPADKTPARSVVRWPWLGWALAASFAGALIYTQLTPPPAAPQAVAVLNGSAQQGSWVVSLNAAKDRLTVQAINAAAIQPDRSLQLWLIPPGEKPQSLGLIATSASQQVSIRPVQLASLPTLAISLEPRGGSPTGQPTGPVLFSGKVIQL
ncbi:anti-sigma factor [Erwinia sp. V90_4]|uniref:anti-sigma factor n=1 Tax=Erwinia sp. V90_4 TaxID=3044239 RepID=UPI00249EDBCC|nr:anti-sigma factor [Erwinia sp. V90_4]MDI3439882.1 anti-sigma factor [Erwinia sp. V90_4]